MYEGREVSTQGMTLKRLSPVPFSRAVHFHSKQNIHETSWNGGDGIDISRHIRGSPSVHVPNNKAKIIMRVPAEPAMKQVHIHIAQGGFVQQKSGHRLITNRQYD